MLMPDTLDHPGPSTCQEHACIAAAGIPRQPEAAVRGHGRVTRRQLLGSRLPQYSERTRRISSEEPESGAWRLEPEAVRSWEAAERWSTGSPSAVTLEPLDAVVLEFQDSADDHDARYIALPDESCLPLNTEFQVHAALLGHAFERLASFQLPGQPLFWDSGDMSVAEAQLCVAVSAASSAQPVDTAQQLQARIRGHNATEIVLVHRSSSVGPAAEQPRMQGALAAGGCGGQLEEGTALCMCEVQVVDKLCKEGRPLDLVAEFTRRDPGVVAIVKQLYSFMAALRLEYGMLSCYEYTVLAWRPLSEPRTLLLSRAFAAAAESPEPTMLAAMAWLQDMAVQRIVVSGSRHEAYTAGPAAGSGAQAAQLGHDELGGGHAGSSAGPAGSSAGPGNAGQRTSAVDRFRAADGALLPVVAWHDVAVNAGDVIGRGASGAGVVLRGACGGQAAAIKVFDGCHALAQARSEAAAYQAILELQGQCVPKLMGVGTMPSGDAFLATSLLLPGIALAELPAELPALGAAAERVLGRVHALGVAHGDVRLENMLVAAAAAPCAAEAAAEVFLVDFSRARCGATQEEMAEEMACLQQLLQARHGD